MIMNNQNTLQTLENVMILNKFIALFENVIIHLFLKY
jgi:hypothetical protein